VFTALTVTTANLNLGKIAIMIVLAIASIKSTLVLLYFMHVRYEKSLLIRLIIPGAIVLLAIFIGLTYSDVVTR
jgi:cytochrome c oxidase subunit 4